MGEAFLVGCDDTNDEADDDVHPAVDMAVSFTEGEQTLELQRVNATVDGTFEVVTTVPPTARPGYATISVGPASMNGTLATVDFNVLVP